MNLEIKKITQLKVINNQFIKINDLLIRNYIINYPKLLSEVRVNITYIIGSYAKT